MHQLEVFVDDFEHARTQHLHGHFTLNALGVFQLGKVHLGNRRAGDGCAIELAEDLIDRAAKSTLNRCHGNLRGKGWHLVLKFGQFIGNVVGEQVATGG